MPSDVQNVSATTLFAPTEVFPESNDHFVFEFIEIDREFRRDEPMYEGLDRGHHNVSGESAAGRHARVRFEQGGGVDRPPFIDDTSCRYSDTIEIDAGPATALVAPAADGIFRYRQRRWHKLVRQHLLPQGTAYAHSGVEPC